MHVKYLSFGKSLQPHDDIVLIKPSPSKQTEHIARLTHQESNTRTQLLGWFLLRRNKN